MTARPGEALVHGSSGPRNTRVPSIDLIWLPLWAIILLSVVLVTGHNALDGINANTLGGFAPLWTVLHAPGILINTGRSVVVVSYVLIPWIGVTALGYALGAIYSWSSERRRSLLSWL